MNRIAHWALLAFFAAQNSSTISVESRLVSVDVIVRDARGNPVAGLKQDAFTISEDGKAQQIVSFEEHHASPSRAGDHSRPLAPGTVTNVSDAIDDSDLNMLLFDLVDTPVLDQPYAGKQMIAFLQKLPPGHQLALFVLSDRLYALQGFTGDSGTLASAAKLINTREMHLTNSESQRARETENLALFEQGLGAGPGNFLADAIREAVEGKEANDMRVRIGLVADAFRAIARSVSGYKGRKNLLWLSETFPVGLADHMQILRSGGIGSGGLPQFEGIRDVSAGSVKILMDLQIAVYPINVVGVETDSVGADLSGVGSAVAPSSADPVSNGRLASSFD
jgi:VWFA-related protein